LPEHNEQLADGELLMKKGEEGAIKPRKERGKKTERHQGEQ
jgi:hypothetical protein